MEFPDFEEFIASLNAHRVRYLIVGAYAVGFHARPRATKDINVLVDRTPANALIVLGMPPVRIDVLTSIAGVVAFAPAWKRRSEGRYGATPTYFLSLPDLIAAKAAAGRPQDLADLDVLERVVARRAASADALPRRPGSLRTKPRARPR